MRTAASERNHVALDAPFIDYSTDIQRNILYNTCPIGYSMPQLCPEHIFSWVSLNIIVNFFVYSFAP